MSWELVTVVVAGIAGLVALLKVTLPYVVARGEAERRAEALKRINERLDIIESQNARRLPIGLPGKRSA